MTEPLITVLIADDQDLVRTGFALVVNSAPDMRVVATAATGKEAVALAAERCPDVILMDIRMPDTDGIIATRTILAAPGPTPKIVALTTYDNDDYATRILNAGASGYLLKDATAEGLTAAIRTVHRGGSVIALGRRGQVVGRQASGVGTHRRLNPIGHSEFVQDAADVFLDG